jgi:protein TonB
VSKTAIETNSAQRSVLIAILLSVLVHLFFFAPLGVIQKWVNDWKAANQKPEPIVMIIENPPADAIKRQIVDTKKGVEVKEAPKNSYLGEKNRVVEEETVAKEIGMVDRVKSRRSESAVTPTEAKQILKKIGVSFAPVLKQPARPTETANWSDSNDMGEKKNEYIKGLKESESTALNTREFVYFSYFQRIRQQLDLAWRPILREEVYRVFRQGRSIATDKDHTTRTVVVINSAGEVVTVRVIEESGTRNLDEAAIRAFNQAGPFPNPPKGLITAGGTVEIRWDFILRT